MGSNRFLGIWLPGNGWPVWGSRIVTPAPEKSPLRIATLGVLNTTSCWLRSRNPSKLDMKNNLFVPLNSPGIWTGPPSVNPY